jgi:uncharacterized membrane protein YgcG
MTSLRILIFFLVLASMHVYTLDIGTAQGVSYLSYVTDLISTSAPGSGFNQSIRFTLAQAIPPSGTIEIHFSGGGVVIPPSGFNFADVDVGFSTTQGGPYIQRPLSSIATGGTDGVTVVPGASGVVRIKLNSSVGIPAGNEVQVLLGTNATHGAQGDTQMFLSSIPGSYPVTIRTYNASDVELDYGQTRIVVVEQVTAGPVDTTDVDPPVILDAQPTGILQYGTQAVQMYLLTDEVASCRFATSSMSYYDMPYLFRGTTTGLVFHHFAQVSGLEDGTTYDHYIRCIDFRANEIDPDFILTFTVGIPPGSATSTSTSTEPGTGTGTATTTATSSCVGPDCVGTGTGSGTGASGSGSGSSPTGGDGAGSGSGGGGGSGTDGGDRLPQADIRISGWAYPGGNVSFIRDGTLVTTRTAGGDGEFDHLTEGLDRGSYTFSVFGVDPDGMRGATFSTTLWLQSDTVNTLSNILLPPTVRLTENSIEPGVPLLVSGYTVPGADVTAWLRTRLGEVSSVDITASTTALGNGTWSLTLPTTGLARGTYELIAQASVPERGVESDRSLRTTVGIGVSVADSDCKSIGDLNCDGAVNLVDFSILLFHWNTAESVADINNDGVVSLPDFSIMLFNWTG